MSSFNECSFRHCNRSPHQQSFRLGRPPEQDEGWVELEAAVADFDGQQFILLAQPLALQQPQVAPVPEHVPVGHQLPQPLQQTDFAAVAHALFYIAEREHEARLNNTN